jgi:hypothetical protein
MQWVGKPTASLESSSRCRNGAGKERQLARKNGDGFQKRRFRVMESYQV